MHIVCIVYTYIIYVIKVKMCKFYFITSIQLNNKVIYKCIIFYSLSLKPYVVVRLQYDVIYVYTYPFKTYRYVQYQMTV